MSHFKGEDFTKTFPSFKHKTSILTLAIEALRNFGEAIAVIEGQTDKRASYSDILQLSSSIASGLQNAGVGEGDYVVLCCEKSILSYSLLLGVWFTGATAILAPIPHVETIHELVGTQTVKAVFSDVAFMPSVITSVDKMSSRPTLMVTVDTEDPVMASILTSSLECIPFQVKDPRKHIPLIVFTGGTTGYPKGIQLTDISLHVIVKSFESEGKLKMQIISSPFYWISAINLFIFGLLRQMTLVISNSWEPKDNYGLIEKHKVDRWFTGTGGLPFYIEEYSKHHYDLSSLKIVLLGGECALTSVTDAFATKVLPEKVDFILLYGSSETGLITHCQYDRKTPGSGETLAPGVEVKIVDSKGSVVPIGSLGDIWVKNLSITPGYWNKPELTSEVLDKDGFFNVGDAGFFDSEGILYVRGRSCDLISFKEHKISPTELEDILYAHPAVLDAAIVGKPHPTDGQHATAYVVPTPGSTVSPQEISEYFNGKVSEHEKLRGGVHFLDVLPRTIIGKVLRKNLRER